MHRERVWTYADLEQFPSGTGKRYEIIDGVLFVSPSPSTRHQIALKWLFDAFLHRLELRDVATVFFASLDVIFSPTRVVVPDLLVVRNERAAIVHERGVEGVPDLIVEVMSPGSRAHDRTRKFELYAKVGVGELWLVDPVGETVEVYVLDDDAFHLVGYHGRGERARSATFDVTIAVDSIFRF